MVKIEELVTTTGSGPTVAWGCFSASTVIYCHSGENTHLWASRVSCIGLPYSFWAGENVMGCFRIA